MELEEIFNCSPEDIISRLTDKTIVVKSWSELEKEYDSSKHDVMDETYYPNITENGEVDYVTRVTYDFQKLMTRRVTELVFGTPVKRVPQLEEGNDKQKDVIKYIENIMRKVRIDSVNIERGNMLFAGCEVMTLWYGVDEQTNVYGFQSPIKLRCRNFSPMNGDELYPYFDEYGDMVALSVKYVRKKLDTEYTYFDVYTKERHVRYQKGENGWDTLEDEQIQIGKIPAIYMYRPTPVWENTSHLVSEIEMSLSRNGNYLRKNAKPLFVVYADEENRIEFGQEKSPTQEHRAILTFPPGSSAGYITWNAATESLRFQIEKLDELMYKQLQLPDLSYESMKSTPMSGEARKQLFMDCHLKVKDESGRIIEFLDREISVIKGFLKIMLPNDYAEAIDTLQIDNIITPYNISDISDRISFLNAATGGKAIMSQREAILNLGMSDDVDKTIAEIQQQETKDGAELSM